MATPDVPEDNVRPVYFIAEDDDEDADPNFKELYEKNYYLEL